MSITLYHGDCIKVMPTLSETYDLVLTSPPYDGEKEYEGKRDLRRYLKFADEWTAHIPRLLNPTGSLFLNLGYTKVAKNEALPLTYLYYPIIRAHGLRLVQEIVWRYPSGMSYKRRFAHRSERWQWWAVNPNVAKFRLDDVRMPAETDDPRNNPLGKNPTDVWDFKHVMNNAAQKATHPCPFPEAMIERIIRACTDAGDNILDPFAGSGTVAEVAQRLDRRVTLIEIKRGRTPILRDRS